MFVSFKSFDCVFLAILLKLFNRKMCLITLRFLIQTKCNVPWEPARILEGVQTEKSPPPTISRKRAPNVMKKPPIR